VIFADTSAVMKLYLEEEGSAEMREFPVLIVSAMCRVEGTSAIWKKLRLGDLDASESEQLIRRFQFDLMPESTGATNLVALPLTGELLRTAAMLVPVHDLTALDAIQLSRALAAREAEPACSSFACYDRTLARSVLRSTEMRLPLAFQPESFLAFE